ncbi:MAG: phosphoribosyltransferase family protein [Nitrososphaeraceae archaeon]
MLLEKITHRFRLKLKDREAAANILGEGIKEIMIEERRKNCIVLGIPRGGVIVGDILASKLGCEFDIVITKRLRAPFNEEIGIGAVTEDGTIYINDYLVRELGISQHYIEAETRHQIQEITYRNSQYRSKRRDHQISGKTVILTDDGAATGATLIAAARWIERKHNPEYLIIAIPIAPKDTIILLKREADEVEVITSPANSSFKSVEQYYQSFEAVPDDKVIQIMKKYSS